jgi:hypothetical protein
MKKIHRGWRKRKPHTGFGGSKYIVGRVVEVIA